jgi:Flp pilus assembly protein TadB
MQSGDVTKIKLRQTIEIGALIAIILAISSVIFQGGRATRAIEMNTAAAEKLEKVLVDVKEEIAEWRELNSEKIHRQDVELNRLIERVKALEDG